MQPNDETMDIKENIRQYIAQNMLFSDLGFAYADDASFLEEAIIDSVGFMELVAFVQKEYDIEVGPQDLVRDNFDSVNKLARYVSSKIAAAQSAV
jgi:acyl carrier protein